MKPNSRAATALLCENNQKGALETGRKEAQGCLTQLSGQCHQPAFKQRLRYAWHYSECGNSYMRLVLREPFEAGFITSPTLEARKLRPRESPSLGTQHVSGRAGRAPEPASG